MVSFLSAALTESTVSLKDSGSNCLVAIAKLNYYSVNACSCNLIFLMYDFSAAEHGKPLFVQFVFVVKSIK